MLQVINHFTAVSITNYKIIQILKFGNFESCFNFQGSFRKLTICMLTLSLRQVKLLGIRADVTLSKLSMK